MSPFAATTRLCGPLNCALSAGPSAKPFSPVPASVRTLPSELISTTRCPPSSTRTSLPSGVKPMPKGSCSDLSPPASTVSFGSAMAGHATASNVNRVRQRMVVLASGGIVAAGCNLPAGVPPTGYKPFTTKDTGDPELIVVGTSLLASGNFHVQHDAGLQVAGRLVGGEQAIADRQLVAGDAVEAFHAHDVRTGHDAAATPGGVEGTVLDSGEPLGTVVTVGNVRVKLHDA